MQFFVYYPARVNNRIVIFFQYMIVINTEHKEIYHAAFVRTGVKSITVSTPELDPDASTAPTDAACEDQSDHRKSFGARNSRLGAIGPSVV
jgi:hypothetical protein